LVRPLMTLAETLVAIWQQAFADEKAVVELPAGAYRVTKTRSKGLRTVRFTYDTYELDGIEQNPETASRWAALAREGKRVMQFSFRGSYVANVCEGKLLRYPAWEKLGLPE
jgi:hypothetical protein